MSITTIARQTQGMRAGEVIAKLAEDAYFTRVENRVTQVPPIRTREADHEATRRSPADSERNRTRGEHRSTSTALGHLLEDLLEDQERPGGRWMTAPQ
jgi:hypothetical protein